MTSETSHEPGCPCLRVIRDFIESGYPINHPDACPDCICEELRGANG